MSDPLRIQLSGPLSVFAAGFLEELLGRGYRPGTAAKQLQLMAHRSRWMAADSLEPGDRVEIERFVRARRATGRVQLASGARWFRCWDTCAGLASRHRPVRVKR